MGLPNGLPNRQSQAGALNNRTGFIIHNYYSQVAIAHEELLQSIFVLNAGLGIHCVVGSVLIFLFSGGICWERHIINRMQTNSGLRADIQGASWPDLGPAVCASR